MARNENLHYKENFRNWLFIVSTSQKKKLLLIYIRQVKFVNFYKLYFPLTYKHEIGTGFSVNEFDSHLTGFIFKFQIVNDVFALYAAGDLHEDIARDILDYLNKETSLVVWDSAISGFELLKKEDVKMTKTLYGEWQVWIFFYFFLILGTLIGSI